MLPNIDYYNQSVAGTAPVRSPEPEKAPVAVSREPAVKEAETSTPNEQARKSETDVRPRREQDQAELNLSLTREEKEALVTAFSSERGVKSMTPDEKETLKAASERISKFVEETIARNASNRERVEKAVGEWYSRMTQNDPQKPADLVNLLRQAAMGNLDGLGA